MTRLLAFSFGGGVQSVAALVLASQGKIDYQTFLFCNVGDDSENPATITYTRDVSAPFAEKHGLAVTELRRERRDGTPETLLGRVNRLQNSIPIPVRMSNGAPGNRQCTHDFKIAVVRRWLREREGKASGATVGLGISLDESHRMRTDDPAVPWLHIEYPLIERRLRRADCEKIITDAGLPMPERSACWFCPFKSPARWRDLRRDDPALFGKAIELEASINAKRDALGRDHVYFTRFNRPLDEATDNRQPDLFGDDCDSGFCLT